MKRSPRLLLAFMLVLVLLSACAVTSRNAIIGKWGNEQQGVVLEFTMDGRLRQTAQGSTSEMNFQFVDDSSITFLTAGSTAGQQPAIKFTVNGDTLTLKVDDPSTGQSSPFDFTRIK
jgi:hypothetical protein